MFKPTKIDYDEYKKYFYLHFTERHDKEDNTIEVIFEFVPKLIPYYAISNPDDYTSWTPKGHEEYAVIEEIAMQECEVEGITKEQYLNTRFNYKLCTDKAIREMALSKKVKIEVLGFSNEYNAGWTATIPSKFIRERAAELAKSIVAAELAKNNAAKDGKN